MPTGLTATLATVSLRLRLLRPSRRAARAIVLPSLAAVALAAGCGGSSFKDDYAPVDGQIHTLGRDLGTELIQKARSQSNKQFGAAMMQLQVRFAAVEKRLGTLSPPDSVKGDVQAMRSSLDAVSGDLGSLVTAARTNDRTAARTTTKRLLTDVAAVSARVKKIRRTLGLKTPA